MDIDGLVSKAMDSWREMSESPEPVAAQQEEGLSVSEAPVSEGEEQPVVADAALEVDSSEEWQDGDLPEYQEDSPEEQPVDNEVSSSETADSMQEIPEPEQTSESAVEIQEEQGDEEGPVSVEEFPEPQEEVELGSDSVHKSNDSPLSVSMGGAQGQGGPQDFTMRGGPDDQEFQSLAGQIEDSLSNSFDDLKTAVVGRLQDSMDRQATIFDALAMD